MTLAPLRREEEKEGFYCSGGPPIFFPLYWVEWVGRSKGIGIPGGRFSRDYARSKAPWLPKRKARGIDLSLFPRTTGGVCGEADRTLTRQGIEVTGKTAAFEAAIHVRNMAPGTPAPPAHHSTQFTVEKYRGPLSKKASFLQTSRGAKRHRLKIVKHTLRGSQYVSNHQFSDVCR